MLARLLGSWSELNIPADCDCFFMIVENDAQTSVVAPPYIGTKSAGALPLFYGLEKEPGIPFARNRAVDMALELGADVLLFIDDDEVADAAWLEQLVAGYRQSGASLVGGPVLAMAPDMELSERQRTVFDGVSARYARTARRSAERVRSGRYDCLTVATNNWLADMRLFRDHGLRFDEQMRHSGGSDAKLSSDAKKLNLKLHWTPEAIVRETVPPERLTFRYQFRRARDHSNASFRRNIARSRLSILSPVISVPLKLARAGFLLAAAPVAGSSALLQAVCAGGWAAGRISVLLGRQSTHYLAETGS
jgi:succinoglycan biosynthesis protein ExoM